MRTHVFSNLAGAENAFWNPFGAQYGEVTSVNVSCSGLPPGASCTFDRNTLEVAPGKVSDIPYTLQTPLMLAPSDYPYTIVASDASLSSSANATLRVGDFSIQVTTPSSVFLTCGFISIPLTAQVVNQYFGSAT